MINLRGWSGIEYGGENIRVNGISRGRIETGVVDKLRGRGEDEGGKGFRDNEKWVRGLGRLGRGEEVGKVVGLVGCDES
ncbi:hypothetical protein [Staphylococcus saprophyticus]|uniref:hypothetical protein n=1 Tax=Staphylococcus saprophyticus TaxID=29385 RepID=UPI0012493C90